MIELLVVVGIITVILLLLLPAIQRSIRQAAATVCMHNLKAINQGLQMYRLDNNGYIPVDAEPPLGSAAAASSWFTKLFPRYLGDLAVFSCPDDPYRHTVRRYALSGAYHSVGATSYGLSDFLLSAMSGYLANLDRHQPKRPHDTLLVADIGPDYVGGGDGPRADAWAAHRVCGRLPWDDSLDVGAVQQTSPWLTARHLGFINALAVDGSVRRVRTRETMHDTIESYYPECAAGDCALCLQLDTPHYSFARSHVYWWTGLVPAP